MAESLSWLPFLLQTADALFPTGAYAHSLGFEESVRLGLIRDEASLAEFLLTQIVPALAHHELPYLRFAYAAAAESDVDELCMIDCEISAWKLANEIRQASAQLGVRRLKALRVISSAPLLESYAAEIGHNGVCGHHLIICALQAATAGMPLRAALATYTYQTLAATCAAALKLIRIGQDGCQRALHRAMLESDHAIDTSLDIQRADAGWFNPLLEIAAMRHERADERLFIS